MNLHSPERFTRDLKIPAFLLALAGGIGALVGALMVSPVPTGALDMTSDGPSLPSTLIGLAAAATAIASARVALKSRYLAALVVVVGAAAAQAVAILAGGAQPLPVSIANVITLGLLSGSSLLLGVAAIGLRITRRSTSDLEATALSLR